MSNEKRLAFASHHSLLFPHYSSLFTHHFSLLTFVPATISAVALPEQLGPYRIAGILGEGGMGAVYRAQDTRLGRDVAIKVLTAVTLSDQEKLQRFEQEARATGMLNHPNLLTIYDVGTTEGTPFLVSELLEGETLRERTDR